ncbi:MAG: metalloregulator ArsR/SmtB family transcription factor [Gammaproteobacteria bacterium]|nr:metalloregulator ArsR/SmtB family transcription factor [Gammaproteobacteria bacterium]
MSSGEFKKQLFAQFARVGKVLGSAHRLELLELLAQGERPVEDLARLTKLPLANVSQHLQQLRRAALVNTRKEGLYVHYSLASPAVSALLIAVQTIAESHLSDVDKLVRIYLSSKDELEPVSRRELLARARDGLVTVLDVRPAAEYAAGHVAGAINVELKDLAKHLHEFKRNREVVAYCRGPFCILAFEAVAQLRAKGFKARRLEGGFPEWKNAELPVATS